MRLTATHAAVHGYLTVLLQTIVITLIGVYLIAFAVRNVQLQWDFDSYLFAARAGLAGLNPYNLAHIELINGRPPEMPFVYPPIALAPFLFLAEMPGAALGWMMAKLALLVGLIVLWWRWFVPGVSLLAVALLGVFGWNAAALWDLRTGNVALLECALLWLAFACYISEKRMAFATLVIIASCFKIMPAAYLLLLVVPSIKQKPRPLGMGIAILVVAVLIVGPLFIGPAARWSGFLENVPIATGLGDANPSGLALAVALVESVGMKTHRVWPLAITVWVLVLGLVVMLSAGLLKESWHRKDPKRWVMLAVMLDLLLAPRPMAYGFIRLGPAPLFFCAELLSRPGWTLMIALLLSMQGLARSARYQSDAMLVTFSPYLLTLGLWLFTAFVCRSRSRSVWSSAAPPPPSAPSA